MCWLIVYICEISFLYMFLWTRNAPHILRSKIVSKCIIIKNVASYHITQHLPLNLYHLPNTLYPLTHNPYPSPS
jgi:hypothetical protein